MRRKGDRSSASSAPPLLSSLKGVAAFMYQMEESSLFKRKHFVPIGQSFVVVCQVVNIYFIQEHQMSYWQSDNLYFASVSFVSLRKLQKFNKGQLRSFILLQMLIISVKTVMLLLCRDQDSWRHFCQEKKSDQCFQTVGQSACHTDPVRYFGCNDRDRLTGEVPRQIPPRGQSLFTQRK